MHRIQISKPIADGAELQQLHKVLDSGWWTGGEAVAEFERLVAEYVGVKYAVAVSSCTTGLHLALLACGVGPGDEVIVPAFTWVSTANAVEYCGAVPIFCDIDLETYNMVVTEHRPWEKKHDESWYPDAPFNWAETKHWVQGHCWHGPKAIIPVHLFGLCYDVQGKLMDPRADYKPSIIEDAACALGATCKGKKAGSLGDVGVFSFHPRKIISTGEGGMITTDDEGIAYECQRLRDHGVSSYFGRKFDHAVFLLGYNYRMSAFQAAVGIAQMGRLEDRVLGNMLSGIHYGHELPSWLYTPRYYKTGHSFQAYVCLLTDDAPMSRDDLIAYMDSKGIECAVGTQCVPMLDYYRNKYGYTPGDYPNAEKAAAQTMALPIGAHMTDEDYERVIDALRGAG